MTYPIERDIPNPI